MYMEMEPNETKFSFQSIKMHKSLKQKKNIDTTGIRTQHMPYYKTSSLPVKPLCLMRVCVAFLDSPSDFFDDDKLEAFTLHISLCRIPCRKIKQCGLTLELTYFRHYCFNLYCSDVGRHVVGVFFLLELSMDIFISVCFCCSLFYAFQRMHSAVQYMHVTLLLQA